MTKENTESFWPVETHPFRGGTQNIYRFSNNYGASVVKNPFSYGGRKGLWELAVIKFLNKKNKNYDLVYDTPVTSDVLGYLTLLEVNDYLTKISKLP